MADAKAKTINLLLYEGDLEGVISIEDSSWNSGELYSAPRDSVSELLETDACKKYGVYYNGPLVKTNPEKIIVNQIIPYRPILFLSRRGAVVHRVAALRSRVALTGWGWLVQWFGRGARTLL